MEGFLPPQAPGPEPELGQRPQPPEPAAPYVEQPAQPQAPPPAWEQQRVEPDNGPAVTGFVLSVVAGGLLIVSGGISSIISLTCSIFGIVYSHRGKTRVRDGVTTRSAGLAQAGFIIGIVSLVLSVLATAAWLIIVILLISDEDFRRDFEDEFDDNNAVTAFVRVAAVTGRALLT
jgi:hypothetical protein